MAFPWPLQALFLTFLFLSELPNRDSTCLNLLIGIRKRGIQSIYFYGSVDLQFNIFCLRYHLLSLVASHWASTAFAWVLATPTSSTTFLAASLALDSFLFKSLFASSYEMRKCLRWVMLEKSWNKRINWKIKKESRKEKCKKIKQSKRNLPCKSWGSYCWSLGRVDVSPALFYQQEAWSFPEAPEQALN